jgi:protein O-mannosyl-transferase
MSFRAMTFRRVKQFCCLHLFSRLLHNRAEIRNTVLICVALAAATVAAFWPVTNAQFINLDDPNYITDNLRVQRGLTLENVKWAFTTFHGSLWHPLTWLSIMLDCELFGVNAGPMHSVNLAFHAASAVMLFLMLNRFTGALWPSAIVAALFALHPLRVESVAWITERKDVLSTFFGILTIWSFGQYVLRRCAGWYMASLLFFAFGLMSKAMLVTLPFVLLLVDFWPLRRIDLEAPPRWKYLSRLVFEKLPFFALAAVSISLTLLAPSKEEAIVSFVHLPLSERMENAIVACMRYLGKTFWPTDLAVYYPHPLEWPAVVVATATALIFIVSALAVGSFRRFPWFFVGWFWFLGTLTPVLGIVQVGSQAMADRFTYVPSIGLLLAIVWMVRELVLHRLTLRLTSLAAAGAIIGACALLTHRQAGYWKNSETLLGHAARITPPSTLLLNSTGDALLDHGQIDEALQKFRAALKLDPEDSLAWGNIANIHFRKGELDQAIENYQQGLRFNPKNVGLHYNLALVLAAKGQFVEAMHHHEQALALDPFYANARFGLGNVYMTSGNPAAAVTNLLAALEMKPRFPAAHYNLGNALLALGRVEEAAKHFADALRLDKDFTDAHRQLAGALQQAGRRAEALPHLQRALALSPSSPGIRTELAALLAGLGQTQGAIEQYREALKLDPNIPGALNNLAWILATHPDAGFRDGTEAVRLAEKAVELTRRNKAFLLGTLAASYAEAGRFNEAVKTAEEAIQLADKHGQKELSAKNRELLGYYRQSRPWREAPPNR